MRYGKYIKGFVAGCFMIAVAISCSDNGNIAYGESTSSRPELSGEKLLGSFEDEQELQRKWQSTPQKWLVMDEGEISHLHSTHGARSLKFIFKGNPDKMSSPQFNICFSGEDRDWSKYDALAVDVFNPQDRSIKLLIRVEGVAVDDPNKSAVCYGIRKLDSQKMNRLEYSLIPMREKIDMSKVNRLMFLLNSPRGDDPDYFDKFTLFFDNIRLIKKKMKVLFLPVH